VAAATRLGRRDEAWKFMLDHYDRKSDWGLKDCALDDDKGNCLAEIQYRSYPEALTAFLARLDAARPGVP
jgi:hypothetical protein